MSFEESLLYCRAGSLIPPKVVADFHIGDKASVWKPTPTRSECVQAISRLGHPLP